MRVCRLDSYGLEQRQVHGYCVRRDETKAYINCG